MPTVAVLPHRYPMRRFLAVFLALVACGDEDDTATPDTLIDAAPAAISNEKVATFSFIATGAITEFRCSFDGAEFETCIPGVSKELADGVHTFAVVAVLNAKVDLTPATHTWRIDTVPPDTSIVDAPPAIDNNAAPLISFTGTDAEGTVTFECSLDGAAAAPCTSPDTLAVGDGNHVFSVTAVDEAGNRDPSPATHDWLISTAQPDTTLLTGPDAGTTTGTSTSFTFSSPDVNATFECALDDGAFAACTSPQAFTGLATGEHTFTVRAVGVAGADPSPATRTWIVDGVGPVVTINTKPTNPSNDTTPQFTFTADETATFECRIDGVTAFTACATPFESPALADGGRTFRVRGTDAFGNVGADATFAWVVDTAAPTVSITSQPLALSNDPTPTVTFTTAGNPAATECQVDAGAFVTCVSGFSPTVADGTHTITVRVTDAATNSSSATTSSFVVDTVAPTATIQTQPAALSNNNTPAMTFTTAGNPTTIQCRADNGPLSSCTTSFTSAALADGNHTLSVRVADGAGNFSVTSTNQFAIDTQAPTVTINTEPPANTNDNTATITFTTAGNPATTECQVDNGAFATCSGSFTSAALVDGPHTITVRVRDAATNEGTDSSSFTVDTVAPTVTINTQPLALSNDTTPTMTFTTSGNPSTTQCRVDNGGLVNCSTGTFNPTVSAGTHTMTVIVTDAATNTSSATTNSFVVDTTPPVVTFNDPPPSQWPVNYYDVAFSANETSTFECSLNNASFAPCTSPLAITFPYQVNNLRVRATDAATNVSQIALTSWNATPGLVLHYPWEQGRTNNTSLLAQSPAFSPDGAAALSTFVGGWAGSALGNSVASHIYLRTSRPLSSSPEGTYAVSFWIRPTVEANGTLLSTIGANTSNGFRVTIQGNVLTVGVQEGTQTFTTQTELPSDMWIHVALRAPGPAKGLQVFIDGAFRQNVPVPNNTGFGTGQASALTVGPFANVDLDDLRFFNTAFDDDSICSKLARGTRNANGGCNVMAPLLEIDFELGRVLNTGRFKLPLSLPQTIAFVSPGSTGALGRLATGFEWGFVDGFRSAAASSAGRTFSFWFVAETSFGTLLDTRQLCFGVGGPSDQCGVSVSYADNGLISVFAGTAAGFQKTITIPVTTTKRNSVVITEQRDATLKTTVSLTVFVNGNKTVIPVGAGNVYENCSESVRFMTTPGLIVDEYEFWPADLATSEELLCENGLDGTFDPSSGSCALTAN